MQPISVAMQQKTCILACHSLVCADSTHTPNVLTHLLASVTRNWNAFTWLEADTPVAKFAMIARVTSPLGYPADVKLLRA